jgi:hypothetical protein
MTRRLTLPGADELFRATGSGGTELAAVDVVAPPDTHPLDRGGEPAVNGAADPVEHRATRSRTAVRQTQRARPSGSAQRQPSGRERHDEKITVYLSPDELVDLERARLALRQDHGLAVDRGRIVREALAIVLADLEHKADGSTLVRHLRDA